MGGTWCWLFDSLQLFKLYAQFKQLHINEPWSVLAGSQLVHVVGEVALEMVARSPKNGLTGHNQQ